MKTNKPAIEARIASATMKSIRDPMDKKALYELDKLFMIKQITESLVRTNTNVLFGYPVRCMSNNA